MMNPTDRVFDGVSSNVIPNGGGCVSYSVMMSSSSLFWAWIFFWNFGGEFSSFNVDLSLVGRGLVNPNTSLLSYFILISWSQLTSSMYVMSISSLILAWCIIELYLVLWRSRTQHTLGCSSWCNNSHSGSNHLSHQTTRIWWIAWECGSDWWDYGCRCSPCWSWVSGWHP